MYEFLTLIDKLLIVLLRMVTTNTAEMTDGEGVKWPNNTNVPVVIITMARVEELKGKWR